MTKAKGLGTEHPYLDHLFWVVSAFRPLCHGENLRAHIEVQAGNAQDCLVGVRVLAAKLWRTYAHTFERDSFLGLRTDMATERASFVGIDMDKRPMRSELARATYNLDRLASKLLTAKSWETYDEAGRQFEEDFFQPLGWVYAESVGPAPGAPRAVSPQELLRLVGAFWIWNEGHDLDAFVPDRHKYIDEFIERHGDGIDVEEDPKEAQREVRRMAQHAGDAARSFPGYRAGLSYLWSAVGHAELALAVQAAKDWTELDGLHPMAREVAIEAPRRTTGIDFVRSDLMVPTGRVRRGHLAALLADVPAPKLSWQEELDERFYWYPTELIDSASSKIYTGAATLASLVVGEATLRWRAGVREPLHVIRFRHPGHPPWFSYALLMQRWGTLSDFSGWLVFSDVGGDYAGLGGSQYAEVEDTLDRLGRRVDVVEHLIAEDGLEEFIEWKTDRSLRKPFHHVGKREAVAYAAKARGQLLGHTRGRLLEFLTAERFRRSLAETRLRYRHRPTLGNREIDVLARQGDRITILECSLAIPMRDLEAFVDELATKRSLVTQDPRHKGCSVSVAFVTTEAALDGLRHDTKLRDALAQAGIELWTLEQHILPGLPKALNSGDLQAMFRAERPVED